MNKRAKTKSRVRREVELSRQKLKPILYDKELSAFQLSNAIDIFDTNLFLEDYDWMHYTLSSRMPTKAYGVIFVEFEYFGAGFSTMKVKTDKKIYTYQFDTRLFHKHIVIFMQKQMRQWEDKRAFFGIEEVVNFYNAVLTHPNTKEEKDDDSGLYCDVFWERMNEKSREEWAQKGRDNYKLAY